MYITCPECHTSFVITPEQLGPGGRKVKCSKCQNIWHAQIETETPVKIEPIVTASYSDSASPVEAGVNLPALLPIRLPFYLCSMPIILISLIIFISIQLFSESFGPFTNHINYHALQIKDINIEHKKDDGMVTVNYKIFNTSNHPVSIPMVRIRLFDKDNRTLQTNMTDGKVAYGDAVTLEANQFLSIKTEFTAIPPSAEMLDITVGDRIDFFLR
ncbi:MAG: MJ0042-type zinc finger domain-containing protein [Pseudomonadota bacterium]